MPDAQPKPTAADVDPPTVGHLRDLWVDWHLDPLPRSQGVALVPAYQAEFDRWLAEHDAQVRREACDILQRLRGGDIEQEYIDHVVGAGPHDTCTIGTDGRCTVPGHAHTDDNGDPT